MKLSKFDNFSDYGTFVSGLDGLELPYVSKIGEDVVGYINKPGVSVEFPATGGGGGGYHLGDEMELTIPYGVDNIPVTIKYKFGDTWVDYIMGSQNTNGLSINESNATVVINFEAGNYVKLQALRKSNGEEFFTEVYPLEMIYPWGEYNWVFVG